ncbi:MAG: bifunctional diaminohydroxyphosphoribosylaminopyrimidine deaminase/5-amino-6-(5-phosphoribosylamino)uracil reductase RibD [Chitinophagaceae bacterium]|nr:bifunctional diaminohydroxyphosphoribosylaminopyrimidine deaminase/5-amino-6-(5-phosphoribosylamino)uracil reductase RibD [Chitinophagaceae bacterium]
MLRCLQLARLGAGNVAPNPMVGAVLVHNNIIIGEGWHKQYGQAHAEVNCINEAIEKGHRDKLNQSTLYVSLEPCAHFGKTPPCADLIIKHHIPKVVVGCRDPFEEVNGKGIEKMQAAGVLVDLVGGELEKECITLNKRFFTYHTKRRPYVVLKWAQTGDGFIAPLDILPTETSGDTVIKRLLISNEYSNRLVHKWRSEEAAILVGTNTALRDDPLLTTRSWTGPSPIRLVLDMNLRLPASLKLFNRETRTIVFNAVKNEENENLLFYRIAKDTNIIQELLSALYKLRIQSVLVEGGAALLESFITEGVWDEIRVITNEELIINNGLKAPVIQSAEKIYSEKVLSDTIETYHPLKY